MRSEGTHPCDDLLDLFLVTLHLENAADLREVDILAPAERDDLVPCAEDLKVDADDVELADSAAAAAAAELGGDAGDEREGREVEEDVGLGVCDEEDVEVLERGVDEADAARLDDGVLRGRRDEAREAREQRLEAWPRKADKLPREERCERDERGSARGSCGRKGRQKGCISAIHDPTGPASALGELESECSPASSGGVRARDSRLPLLVTMLAARTTCTRKGSYEPHARVQRGQRAARGRTRVHVERARGDEQSAGRGSSTGGQRPSVRARQGERAQERTMAAQRQTTSEATTVNRGGAKSSTAEITSAAQSFTF